MVELTRTVRFCIPFDDSTLSLALTSPYHNTFAGAPTMAGFGAYYEIDVACRGIEHEPTGYVVDITRIDASVRRIAVPIIASAMRDEPAAEPSRLLVRIAAALADDLGSIASVTWRLTPFFHLTLEAAAMDRIVIRQQFGFAAAHRLHCPDLEDDENRRIFGRCNNPNGHGHNYRLEVAVRVPLPEAGPPPLALPELEAIVDETVVKRFDHTHLNLDRPEFAELNPSVEHIARTCHGLLAEPLEAAGGALVAVTVWETDKTCCVYPAP